MAENELPNAIQGRNDHVQQTHFLRLNFEYSDNTLSYRVGTLPNDAIILRGTLAISKPFSAGKATFNFVDDENALTTADLTKAGIIALSLDQSKSITTKDVDLLMTLDQQATAGEGSIIFEFIANR